MGCRRNCLQWARSAAFTAILVAGGLVGEGTAALLLHNSNLRPTASTNHPPLALLHAGDSVDVLSPKARNGYLRVTTADGTTGWVLKRNVGQEGNPQPVPIPTPAPAPTPGGSHGFPADWARPDPQEEEFIGSSGVPCEADGKGAHALDTVTNPRKNRVDPADPTHVLSLATIQALPADPNNPHNRTTWTASQEAAIAPFEGVAVSATGFLATVDTKGNRARHEKGESCNCGLLGTDEVDWHMYLTPHKGDPKSSAVVVEITPRVRKGHPGWTDAALNAASDSVRVTGWLMYDPEHPDQVGQSRGTVWEVHPITKLERWDGTQWKSLDE